MFWRTVNKHTFLLQLTFGVRVQLDRLDHEDLMVLRDHLDHQDPAVYLEPKVGQELQAIQVHLDHSASLDSQVFTEIYWNRDLVLMSD